MSERDAWTEQEWMQQAEPDPGPTEQQIIDWNIHNDHAAGTDYPPELDDPEFDPPELERPMPEAGG